MNRQVIPKKVIDLNVQKPNVYFFTKRPSSEDINRPNPKTKKTGKKYNAKGNDDLEHFREKRSTDKIHESNRTVELSPKMNISQIAPKKDLSVGEKNDSFMDTDDYDDVKHDVNNFHLYEKPSKSNSIDFYDSN